MKIINNSFKFFVLTFCTLFLLTSIAMAGKTKVFINIPPLEIKQALDEFAKQTGFSFAYSIEKFDSLKTQEVNGKFSPEHALEIMLKGTGIEFKRIGETVISIKKASSQNTSSHKLITNSNAEKSNNASALTAANGQSDEPALQAGDQSKDKDDYLFQEMIVTASKRPRKLQEVPISIYALTNEAIEAYGITNIEDMRDKVAGLEILSAGNGTVSIASRGITNMSGGLETTAAIGYYMDEVPISSISTAMPDIAMWDIARVEVLRGPQGTLFGEGSMGGTIRVITNKPDTTEFSSRVGSDISSTKMGGINYSIKGMVNIPVVKEKLAFRVLADHTYDDGWIDVPDLGLEDANKFDQTNGRVVALWTPNEKLRLEGSVSSLRRDSEGSYLETTRGVQRLTDLNPAFYPIYALSKRDTEHDIVNLTLEYDMGIATLVSATSYFQHDLATFTDRTAALSLYPTEVAPGVFMPLSLFISDGQDIVFGDYTIKLWSQELRLVSNGDEKFDWTVGVFYKKNNREQVFTNIVTLYDYPNPLLPPVFQDTIKYRLEDDSSAYALFADADYDFNSKLSLGTGIRYYKDDREKIRTLLIPGLLSGENPALVDVPQSVTGGDSAFTPRLSLNWKPSKDILIFTKVAKGFRNGGANLNGPANPEIPDSFGPENLLAYEAGIKTNLWAGLTMNAYLYYNDWTDLQLNFTAVNPVSNVTESFVQNAGAASSFGGEFEVFAAVLPVQGLTANLSISYTDAELSEDVVDIYGNFLAKKGNVIPLTPKWKFNIGAQYTRPLFDDIFGVIRASYTHRTETYSGSGNNENFKNDAYNQVSASLGIESDSWSLLLYAKNLFDSDDTINKDMANVSVPEAIYSTYVRPQTIGLKFTAKF